MTCNNFLGDEGTSPDNTEIYLCYMKCDDVESISKEFFYSRLNMIESKSFVGHS